jgi:hypothetical protein
VAVAVAAWLMVMLEGESTDRTVDPEGIPDPEILSPDLMSDVLPMPETVCDPSVVFPDTEDPE